MGAYRFVRAFTDPESLRDSIPRWVSSDVCWQRSRMRRLGRLSLDYLREAALFLAASTGAAAVATIVLPFFGYATFGDRPGPGWYDPAIRPTWAALRELSGYALALPVFGAMVVAMYFVVPFAVVRAMQHYRVPMPVVRIAGALSCALLASVVISAAGWYIALGAVAGSAGIVGSFVYGAWRLPRRRRVAEWVREDAPAAQPDSE